VEDFSKDVNNGTFYWDAKPKVEYDMFTEDITVYCDSWISTTKGKELKVKFDKLKGEQ
jgi:hypothetical protein